MAVVIKSNQRFNAPNLPVIAPFLANGLQALWRFREGSLLDLSGNQNTLTKVGNPTIEDGKIVGDGSNGFETSVSETESFSIAVVVRVTKGDDGTFDEAKFVRVPESSLQIYARKVSTDEYKIGGGVRALVKADNTQKYRGLPLSPQADKYTFLVMSVDALSDTISLHAPKSGDINDNQNTKYDFSGRNLGGQLKLFLAGGDASGELLEFAYYDRALTQQEVELQYKLSKDYHAKHNNITI